MGVRTRVYPVILSGGSGTRLWPLSRAQYPKQLLALTGDRSLLQETVLRIETEDIFHLPTVVTNDDHRFVVAEQLREIGTSAKAILLEPVARNTAPAAVVAAVHLSKEDPEAVVVLMPSDHLVREPTVFEAAVELAVEAVKRGRLVTFGITPTRADTGYGYIQSGAPLDGAAGCFEVSEFVEKPDTETAERYLAEGTYSWNSGMFVFQLAIFSRSTNDFIQIVTPCVAEPSRRRQAILISFGSAMTLLRPLSQNRLTTPSWSAQRMPWLFPPKWDGAMLAAGTHYGRPQARYGWKCDYRRYPRGRCVRQLPEDCGRAPAGRIGCRQFNRRRDRRRNHRRPKGWCWRTGSKVYLRN